MSAGAVADHDKLRRRAEHRTLALGASMGVVGAIALKLILPELAVPPHPVAWWLLAIGFFLAETLTFDLEVDHEAYTFSFSEAPLVFGLLFASPIGLVAARIAGEFAHLVMQQRRRPHKIFFNLCMFLVECVVALVLFQGIAHARSARSPLAWVAMLVAIAAADLVSIAAVFVVIHWHGASGNTKNVLLTGGFTAVTNTTITLLVAIVVPDSWMALGLLGVLAITLSIAYRSYTSLRRRFERLQLFHEFTSAVGSGGSPHIVMERVLREARKLMRVEYAMIAVLGVNEPEDAVLCELRSTQPLAIRHEPTRNLLQHEVVRAAVDGRRAVVVDRWADGVAERSMRDWLDVRDCVVASLHGDGVDALLVVGERIGEVSSFDAHDGLIVETLANHSSVALENSRLIDRLTAEVKEREYQALHDALTGLPNRTEFLRRVDVALGNTGAQVGVLLMDLDRFKEVNDTLGHYSGDLMLEEVARRVRECVPEDGCVARFGGDEFAVLLPTGATRDVTLAFADTLRGILSAPVRVGDIVLEIQWSIGIALAPDDGNQSAVLLRHADVAMYEAKRTKSGVQLYDANLDPNSVERLEFASSLRHAIDHGHIVVYYQPKARLDGTVVGVEALCRWEHETLGLVEPSQFIAVAEHNGLITRLTDYVIDRALRDCALWRAQGRPIGVAINVSPTCLVDVDFPDRLRNLLTKRVIPAERVTLEITESGVLELTRAHSVLAALNELGVRLSVDDFGTGYSSLSYLHTLPVQEVKIDRSFVTRLASADGDAGIVKAIVDLGHNLGLTVVAEGVEDDVGWEQLAALGCDQIQGYYLSRPLPEEDFTTWLHRREAAIAH